MDGWMDVMGSIMSIIELWMEWEIGVCPFFFILAWAPFCQRGVCIYATEMFLRAQSGQNSREQ
jgi:hypothetical protein